MKSPLERNGMTYVENLRFARDLRKSLHRYYYDRYKRSFKRFRNKEIDLVN